MKSCKRIIISVITVMLITSCCVFPAHAAPLTVYVTVSDGSLALALKPVTVTDADNDGILSVNDALLLAHQAYYTDGADGYGTATGQYGLYVTKLWGVENGGGYGYYLNNSPTVLTDTLSDGDVISAFVYTDLENYSDKYSCFTPFNITAAPGTPFTLTLTSMGFMDSAFGPEADVKILIDGIESNFVTAADGTVTLVFDDDGSHIISASATGLVPTACAVTVTGIPCTGDNDVTLYALAAVILVCSAAFTLRMKKTNEA